MTELERKAEAFIDATDMHVAEADASGLPPIAVARLLFGFSVLLLERRDGLDGAVRFLRHQLNRLEMAQSHGPDYSAEFPDLYSLRSNPDED